MTIAHCYMNDRRSAKQGSNDMHNQYTHAVTQDSGNN